MSIARLKLDIGTVNPGKASDRSQPVVPVKVMSSAARQVEQHASSGVDAAKISAAVVASSARHDQQQPAPVIASRRRLSCRHLQCRLRRNRNVAINRKDTSADTINRRDIKLVIGTRRAGKRQSLASRNVQGCISSKRDVVRSKINRQIRLNTVKISIRRSIKCRR